MSYFPRCKTGPGVYPPTKLQFHTKVWESITDPKQNPIIRDELCSLACFIKKDLIHYALYLWFLHCAHPFVECDEKFHTKWDKGFLIGSQKVLWAIILFSCALNGIYWSLRAEKQEVNFYFCLSGSFPVSCWFGLHRNKHWVLHEKKTLQRLQVLEK